jgi:hypothetical protein
LAAVVAAALAAVVGAAQVLVLRAAVALAVLALLQAAVALAELPVEAAVPLELLLSRQSLLAATARSSPSPEKPT